MFRLVYRIPLLLLHAVIGLPLTLLTFNPVGRRIPTWSPFGGRRTLDQTMTCWWSANLCRIFGLRRRVNRAFPPGPQLVVSNHISWLDIQLLHSCSPMGFIGKAEIRQWFVLGFLAAAGGTVFHHRGSHDSSSGVIGAMSERLNSGGKVAIFPEGGILPGRGIKHFHARLFAAAVENSSPVQPVMLRYLYRTNDGGESGERHYKGITFYPGESMSANLFRLLSQKPCIAEVRLLEPYDPAGLQRKEVARLAQEAVADAYDCFGTEPNGAEPNGNEGPDR
jgi:1-acyl-sn-glycerol-3-phosphate acyltransferase